MAGTGDEHSSQILLWRPRYGDMSAVQLEASRLWVLHMGLLMIQGVSHLKVTKRVSYLGERL
jgi:hypothetical protein